MKNKPAISKETLAQWRKKAENTDFIAELGDHTPSEFIELLDYVEELDTKPATKPQLLALRDALLAWKDKDAATAADNLIDILSQPVRSRGSDSSSQSEALNAWFADNWDAIPEVSF